MHKSTISIDVMLDNNKIPEQILWEASDSSAEMKQKAKAFCLAFWDGQDKTALRIDLWTKDMMVDEMGDFVYQMFFTLAETFQKATGQNELSEEIKTFAGNFDKKFKSKLVNPAG